MPPGRGGRSWGRAVPWALVAAEVAGDATAWEAGTGPTVTGLASGMGSFRDELPFSPPASSEEIKTRWAGRQQAGILLPQCLHPAHSRCFVGQTAYMYTSMGGPFARLAKPALQFWRIEPPKGGREGRCQASCRELYVSCLIQ